MRRRLLLLVFAVVAAAALLSGQAQAEPWPDGDQPALDLRGLERVKLDPWLELLEDAGGQLAFEDVSAPEHAGAFRSIGQQATNFGFTDSVWWVRFRLSNPSGKPLHAVIRQDYPLIDHVDFWGRDDAGHWQRQATGDRLPFDSRPIDNRTFLFPVELPADSERIFYMRFQSDGPMNIGLFAHSQNDLIGLITHEYLAMGIYYGGFIVLLVYNLIMFMTVRERAFAHYLLYVLSYGLYFSVHNGLSFQYLWPGNAWLANQSLLLLLALSLLGCVRFTRTILSSASLAPVADRIAWAMELCMILAFALTPFLEYRTLIVPMAFATAVICLHMLLMGALALVRGSRPARYYMVAFSALLAGVLAYMLKTFGLLPHNVYTQNAFQLGSLLEMVLLSLAVGARISELRERSFADALTQLHNRRYFNDQIATEFYRSRRRGRPLSLVVLDIDHFKRFNDTYGHAKGDQALKAVARVLATCVRKPNVPCRYGGEEFVVILPNTTEAQVEVVAERIRREVEQSTAETFGLSVSVGHATLDDANFGNPQELFVAADFALYTAKDGGRNRVVGYRSCESKRKGEPSGAPLRDFEIPAG
ncbi:MAG: GGDEF domain-containing protein [Oceanospirillaceae bacterium]|nr:GGDEF domain-containing protein [Oceanospirillaceae bacterium]